MGVNFNDKKRSYDELSVIATEIRKSIIKMLVEAGSGHSAGPLGLSEVLTALYFDVMRHDPARPDWDLRDIFLLSNGHCAPVQYAAMAHAGYMKLNELTTLRRFGSRLQGHPERTKLPGLENTSGPLGCGLSQACGISLALKMNSQNQRWVYVVMGDGELNEGNVWEAAMFASKYRCSNIIALIDRNNIQIDGQTEDVMPLEDLKAKWESFGWHVLEIDGNNIEAVLDAYSMAKAIVEKPTVIVAHTIPGKGVDFMEYDYRWHGKPPNKDEAALALKELRTLKGKIRSEND